MKKAAPLLVAALLAATFLPAAAAGDRRGGIGRAGAEETGHDNRPGREVRKRDREERKQRRGSAQDAARIAQQMNGGGRVLSVNPVGDAYRVRLLKDGEVRSYTVKVD